MSEPLPPPALRRHQAAALAALDDAWAAERQRCWVVLPPGAGKTRVGLETVRRLVDRGEVGRAVVLGPNTAIQDQWVRQARDLGLEAAPERDLQTLVSALTYQSLAVFDPDDEDGSEPGEGQASLVSRLHDNGRALVARLQSAGPILLVLDECHHLLEVWGRLLAELLVELPQARVLGLTATPPATMTQPQAALVDELFGAPVFEASIPAVVREGDLAPFAELVWLTTPTPAEQDWLDEGASRFRELTTALTRPGFGSTGFLAWCDARFVDRGDTDPGWPALVRAEPEMTTAALRLHHAGLLALPPGARMAEEHRVEPTADDWILLVDDWLRRCITASDEPGDDAVLDAVRRALPAVGWVWTRRGVRRGRTPVDRVLARSESKTTATVAVVDAERRTLGERLRMLVLCDHESARATLPVDLEGVLAQQAGSAWAVLAALVASPAGADALLVTGRSVAGDEATLRRLVTHVAETDAGLASRLVVVPGTGVERGVARLEGRWTSRTWVRHVTAFFEAGGTHVLVGTRGLLGEGWDARRVSGLVDLTSATTSTAVVQTRGRALRTDPTWPDKVALTWSVTCVAPEHPRGGNDWSRLVRKHAGYFGVDEDGEVVDGVAHLDDAFSPFAPPDPAELDAVNARMLLRAEHRDAVRERWAVGTPYDDRAARSVRIRPRRANAVADTTGVPGVVQREDGLEVRGPGGAGPAVWPTTAVVALALGGAAALGTPLAWVLGVVVAVLAVTVAGTLWVRREAERGRALLAAAAEPPSLARIAAAVADGLHRADLVEVGAEAVSVEVDASGEYRCVLTGVPEAGSSLFAEALDDVVSPLVSPRYVIARWVSAPPDGTLGEALAAARGRPRPAAHVTWHAVPTVLGAQAEGARAFAAAWDHWVGGGRPLWTGGPEGAGVLAAQRGADPLDVTTVMRRTWS